MVADLARYIFLASNWFLQYQTTTKWQQKQTAKYTS